MLSPVSCLPFIQGAELDVLSNADEMPTAGLKTPLISLLVGTSDLLLPFNASLRFSDSLGGLFWVPTCPLIWQHSQSMVVTCQGGRWHWAARPGAVQMAPGAFLAGIFFLARPAFCKPQHFVGWSMSHRGSQNPATPGILYLPSHFNFS